MAMSAAGEGTRNHLTMEGSDSDALSSDTGGVYRYPRPLPPGGFVWARTGRELSLESMVIPTCFALPWQRLPGMEARTPGRRQAIMDMVQHHIDEIVDQSPMFMSRRCLTAQRIERLFCYYEVIQPYLRNQLQGMSVKIERQFGIGEWPDHYDCTDTEARDPDAAHIGLVRSNQRSDGHRASEEVFLPRLFRRHWGPWTAPIPSAVVEKYCSVQPYTFELPNRRFITIHRLMFHEGVDQALIDKAETLAMWYRGNFTDARRMRRAPATPESERGEPTERRMRPDPRPVTQDWRAIYREIDMEYGQDLDTHIKTLSETLGFDLSNPNTFKRYHKESCRALWDEKAIVLVAQQTLVIEECAARLYIMKAKEACQERDSGVPWRKWRARIPTWKKCLASVRYSTAEQITHSFGSINLSNFNPTFVPEALYFYSGGEPPANYPPRGKPYPCHYSVLYHPSERHPLDLSSDESQDDPDESDLDSDSDDQSEEESDNGEGNPTKKRRLESPEGDGDDRAGQDEDGGDQERDHTVKVRPFREDLECDYTDEELRSLRPFLV